jgi:hypothetical protein
VEDRETEGGEVVCRELEDQVPGQRQIDTAIVIGQILAFAYWCSFLHSMVGGAIGIIACVIAAILLAYVGHHIMTLGVIFAFECCGFLTVQDSAPAGQR